MEQDTTKGVLQDIRRINKLNEATLHCPTRL